LVEKGFAFPSPLLYEWDELEIALEKPLYIDDFAMYNVMNSM